MRARIQDKVQQHRENRPSLDHLDVREQYANKAKLQAEGVIRLANTPFVSEEEVRRAQTTLANATYALNQIAYERVDIARAMQQEDEKLAAAEAADDVTLDVLDRCEKMCADDPNNRFNAENFAVHKWECMARLRDIINSELPVSDKRVLINMLCK